jgi:hypothetical protein
LSASSASVSMMIWRWLRKYAGMVFCAMPSRPLLSFDASAGQRRIRLGLRVTFGFGTRLSVTTRRTTTSSPFASDNAPRSSACR